MAIFDPVSQGFSESKNSSVYEFAMIEVYTSCKPLIAGFLSKQVALGN